MKRSICLCLRVPALKAGASTPGFADISWMHKLLWPFTTPHCPLSLSPSPVTFFCPNSSSSTFIYFLLSIPHTWDKAVWNLSSFWVWLILFNIVIYCSIRFLSNNIISSFFVDELCVYRHVCFRLQSSLSIHLLTGAQAASITWLLWRLPK